MDGETESVDDCLIDGSRTTVNGQQRQQRRAEVYDLMEREMVGVLLGMRKRKGKMMGDQGEAA